MTVRAWDILLIGALSRPSGTAATVLLKYFTAFTLAYSTSLNPYHTPSVLDSPDTQDRAHADISYAYASMKLWLLLARKTAVEQPVVGASGSLQDIEGFAVKMIWNELWPPFESVLEAFEMDARAGNHSVSAQCS